jgi:small nuclear ribonucleoprotein D3
MTGRDGRIVKMENVFLRGGLVKFIVLPELLKSAPIFKKVQGMQKKQEKAKPDSAKGGDRKTTRAQKK